MVTKEHRDFELCSLILALLHDSTAKVLMEDMGPNRIDWC